MEDLTAIIPYTFDFVDEIDDILGEVEQPVQLYSQPFYGKCQSLFVTSQTSL